jgi:hypothetical protein
MKFRFLDAEGKYDGTQLVSLRNYLAHGLLGDSVVAWVGACDVSFDHMVDGEDLLARAEIRGSKMLHFIIEKFDVSLFTAVALQRLLAAVVRDQVKTLSPNTALTESMFREGDDLYAPDGGGGRRKFSISIATQSPVSSLIHFAVNVSNQGTPVKTMALEDLGIEPGKLAEKVMQAFCAEVTSMQEAAQKVRWVK